MGKHAVKHCPVLKGEHTPAMLLLQLPLPLVLGTRGVVQGAVAMPLAILELSLIPTVGSVYSTRQAGCTSMDSCICMTGLPRRELMQACYRNMTGL